MLDVPGLLSEVVVLTVTVVPRVTVMVAVVDTVVVAGAADVVMVTVFVALPIATKRLAEISTPAMIIAAAMTR